MYAYVSCVKLDRQPQIQPPRRPLLTSQQLSKCPCSESGNSPLPEALSRHHRGGLLHACKTHLQLQDIVSKTNFNVLQFVLQFYKNNNRKPCFSKACGCFEMVEATGVEPVS